MTISKRSLTNARVARLPASGIRRFFDLAATLEGAISLGVGEPDFVTPDAFRDAAVRSIREGKTQYTSNYGLLALREAIAAHIQGMHGVSYDPRGEILVTVGVSEAVDLALRSTLNEGDEVIVADPSYVAYLPRDHPCRWPAGPGPDARGGGLPAHPGGGAGGDHATHPGDPPWVPEQSHRRGAHGRGHRGDRRPRARARPARVRR